jgi:hypothetical protein
VSKLLQGEIKIRLNYMPTLKTKIESITALKQNMVTKLRESFVSKQQITENSHKKDVTELIQSMNNPNSQKAAVAYLSLDYVRLQNIDAKKCSALQSIMIEICFGQQKV